MKNNQPNNLWLSIFAIFLSFVLTSCNSAQEDTQQTSNLSESQKANDFFEKAFQTELSFSPEYQSYLGIKDNADKMG